MSQSPLRDRGAMTAPQIVIEAPPAARAPAPIIGAVVLAGAAVVAAIVGADQHADALGNAVASMVIAWALLTLFLAMRRSDQVLFAFTGAASIAGGLALTSDRFAGFVPYALCAVAIALPDGLVVRRPERHAKSALVTATVIALPFIGITAASSDPALALVGIQAGVLGVVALIAYLLNCRTVGALDRARLQWAGWGVVVSGCVMLAILLMHALLGWPDALGALLVVA